MQEIKIFRTIKLDYPIKDGEGKEIAELHVRRAKAKDVRQVAKRGDEIEQTFHLMSILTGLVPEDIEELDIADFKKVQSAIEEMQKGKSASVG